MGDGINKLAETAAKACKAAKWKKRIIEVEGQKKELLGEVGSKSSSCQGKESNEKIFKELTWKKKKKQEREQKLALEKVQKEKHVKQMKLLLVTEFDTKKRNFNKRVMRETVSKHHNEQSWKQCGRDLRGRVEKTRKVNGEKADKERAAKAQAEKTWKEKTSKEKAIKRTAAYEKVLKYRKKAEKAMKSRRELLGKVKVKVAEEAKKKDERDAKEHAREKNMAA